MTLFWTPEALQDREDIYDYIEVENPAAALGLDAMIAEKAGRLAEHPALGRPGRVGGTRELIAHENYLLIYDIVGGQVRVLRVMHASRRWPPQA
ncbi:type II toxin-antitoxin system mRNA interferase toxin, RelE/StbE family [Cupriavidus malaysiensis]|uniref:Addiction module toxin RelE n=1 Tax=Cupriavidus malaysiensis TaxID=367825 RepID=A0ABM6F8Q2_9BURK|nr:type II toxin-antitoxin system mRNA interferase toxin, RelE/StbE family [Cupriavidus malaysiensis]AOZ07993.1 addiction module toxin RelE [Cupriavidus malaysiensis]